MTTLELGKEVENYEAAVQMFKDMEMTKQKEITKRCVKINEFDRYSRWGVKMLTTLSKEMTNGKLEAKPI